MPREDTYEWFWDGSPSGNGIDRLETALIQYGTDTQSAREIARRYAMNELMEGDSSRILRCEEWIDSNDLWSMVESPARRRRGHPSSRSQRLRWNEIFVKVDKNNINNTWKDNPFKEHVGVELEVGDYKVKMHLQPDDIPKWDCVHDGSVECGSEFRLRHVSSGDRLFKDVEEMCVALHKRGYITDESCSVHIHIDAEDLKLKHLKNLVKIHERYDKFIYEMLHSSRIESRFCRPTGITRKSRILGDVYSFEPLNKAMKKDNLRDFKRSYYEVPASHINIEEQNHKYYDGRYWGLNVHSVFLNGTVELRHLQGTIDPVVINAWILINLALLNKAKEGLTRREKRILEYNNEPVFREFVNLMPDNIQILFEKYHDKEHKKREALYSTE
jgi:hypothetical protein